MVFKIDLQNRRAYSSRAYPSRASGGEAKARTKDGTALSERKGFVGALIIVLATLLLVQTSGVGTSADVSSEQVWVIEASTNENASVGVPFPGALDLVVTSPYAHEPLSISSSSAGMNLPK